MNSLSLILIRETWLQSKLFSATRYRMEMLLIANVYQLSFLIITKMGRLWFCFDFVITELHFNHNDSQHVSFQVNGHSFTIHGCLWILICIHIEHAKLKTKKKGKMRNVSPEVAYLNTMEPINTCFPKSVSNINF